jgi:hypothetical protein
VSQQVNVPGVGMLEFPEGMSEPDMAAAIRKNFPEIHPPQKMIQAIQADAGARASPIFQPGPDGRIAGILPATPGGLRFDALKQLRSEVGPNAVTSALMGDKEAGQWKQLYAGMSKDLESAATRVDAERAAQTLLGSPGTTGPPKPPVPSTSTAWTQAKTANKAMMDKADLLGPYANAQDPQQAYAMLSNTMGNKGPTAQTILGGKPGTSGKSRSRTLYSPADSRSRPGRIRRRVPHRQRSAKQVLYRSDAEEDRLDGASGTGASCPARGYVTNAAVTGRPKGYWQ